MNKDLATELYKQEHERLLPHIDTLIGQLTHKVNSKQLNYEDAFYVLSKAMIYMAEHMYTNREDYVADIEKTMSNVTQYLLPSLPDEEQNFMAPRLILTAANIIEYVAWHSNMNTQPAE